jgi:cullin-associated NEDD8-dissociated protein 1
VGRCPHDTKAFLPDIAAIAIASLKHDPNYVDDMEDDEEEGEEDDEEDEDDDDAYEDDEDTSWKVGVWG